LIFFQTSKPFENRTATRYGNEMIDSINLLAMILPGSVVIQQGDELGVADTIIEWATTTSKCWPSPMVPSAAPFPWSDGNNGGFSDGEPWMPIVPNYRYANAKTEFANDNSHVGVVRVAAAMRKSPAIGPHVEVS
jgi:alpha-glucosidase